MSVKFLPLLVVKEFKEQWNHLKMKPFVKAKLQCHTISAATLVVYQEKICCVCTPIEVEDLVLVVMTLGDPVSSAQYNLNICLFTFVAIHQCSKLL